MSPAPAAGPSISEAAVHRQARLHLAGVLGVLPESLIQMPSPEVPCQRRQFNRMRRELAVVADEQLCREMAAGTLLLSLHMYCAQMARCSAIHSDRVARVLGLKSLS